MGSLLEELNRQVAAYTPRVLQAVGTLLLFWAANAAVRALLRRVTRAAPAHRQDIYLLGQRVAWVGLWAFALVTVLGTLGVNVSALVAGLGLTGFALGFALKDAVSNLLAGLMILFYRPFRRADHVAVSGLEGEVTEINLRYTVLQSGERIYMVPNSILLNSPITIARAPLEPVFDTAVPERSTGSERGAALRPAAGETAQEQAPTSTLHPRVA